MARGKSSLPTKPTIILDTREQKPLFAENPDGDKEVAAYIRAKVDAGDYTILDVPNLVIAERKAHGKELFSNLVLKREVFMRSIERMRKFKHKYIIIEQTYAEFLDPRNWTFIGNTKRRYQAIATVESWLISLSQTEDIHFFFTGEKHAARAVKKILVKTYEWHRKQLMKKDKELDDLTD